MDVVVPNSRFGVDDSPDDSLPPLVDNEYLCGQHIVVA